MIKDKGFGLVRNNPNFDHCQKAYDLETWHEASRGGGALQSLYKS